MSFRMGEPIEIQVITESSGQKFREEIQPRRRPAVLRGLELGPCVEKWNNLEYLCSRTENKPVKVHLTKNRDMDFRAKNFTYQVMNLHDLFRRACNGNEGDELVYLRDIGDDARGRNVVNFHQDFPDLGPDLIDDLDLFDKERFFSSVLRISSPGIRVWTHYDVLDNVYIQIVGEKTAILWPPNEALNLYLDGDKSKVVDIDNPDPETFPLFYRAQRYVAHLKPGDVLFIPSMWFHNMTAKDFGVAVNTFWKNLDPSVYDKKDPYGNRDLLPGAKALRMLDNVIRQLDELPEDIRDFYGRQLIAKLERKVLSA